MNKYFVYLLLPRGGYYPMVVTSWSHDGARDKAQEWAQMSGVKNVGAGVCRVGIDAAWDANWKARHGEPQIEI